MFAWLHQSMPIEKENLLLLLKDCDKNDLSDQIQAAVAHITDGVCHALKIRVETILAASHDLIILYSVSNLIRFYQTILGQIVRGGTLEECLVNLHSYSETNYLKVLTTNVKNLLQKSNGTGMEPPPSNDLVPSQSVTQSLRILKELLSVASMVESRQTDITKVIFFLFHRLANVNR